MDSCGCWKRRGSAEKAEEEFEEFESTEKVEKKEEATVLVEEPKDEMCPDAIFTKHGNDKPIPTTRQSSFRGFGGVDY